MYYYLYNNILYSFTHRQTVCSGDGGSDGVHAFMFALQRMLYSIRVLVIKSFRVLKWIFVRFYFSSLHNFSFRSIYWLVRMRNEGSKFIASDCVGVCVCVIQMHYSELGERINLIKWVIVTKIAWSAIVHRTNVDWVLFGRESYRLIGDWYDGARGQWILENKQI